MYYPIINSIKPTTITRRREIKEIIIITIIVSSKTLIIKGTMKATIPHYRSRRWKIDVIVVAVRDTRVPNVQRRTAPHGLNGRSIKLPSCVEFSKCSNR